MSSQTLARPYAKAAFELALTNGNEQDWNIMFQSAKKLITNDHQDILSKLIKDPRVDENNKFEILISILEKANSKIFNKDGELQKQFIKVLAENQRLDILSQIADFFADYLANKNGEYLLELESAYPISQEVENLLTKKLQKVFGVKLFPQISINKKLIGGFRASVGSRVYDCSLTTTLNNARRDLIL